MAAGYTRAARPSSVSLLSLFVGSRKSTRQYHQRNHRNALKEIRAADDSKKDEKAGQAKERLPEQRQRLRCEPPEPEASDESD